MDKKLGIIVPYRNRYEHLLTFKHAIAEYFSKLTIKYELIIVEQDDAKTFNRGKLLNIGFLQAKKLGCDYVIFHDIDMIPVEVDYSYSDKPIHLASSFQSDDGTERIIFDEYFGGVTLFPVDLFEKINGYSNEYWGWGFEDDDLFYRCKQYRLPFDIKKVINLDHNTLALNFNGVNTNIKIKEDIDFTKSFSTFICFNPDNVTLNHEEYDDKFTILSIPSLGVELGYNSYKRYNIVLQDSEENYLYINSDIKPTYPTSIVLTFDIENKVISMYQDGEFVGYTTYKDDLQSRRSTSSFILGAGIDGLSNLFKGSFTQFATFDKVLDSKEIETISNNKTYGLTQNFKNYTSSENLKVYYDAKFIKNYKLINIATGALTGKIVNCDVAEHLGESTSNIPVPFRRSSIFRLLSHEENGYVEGGWKEITTRYNQLKYVNEVLRGTHSTKQDGLNTCKYKVHSQVTVNNQTHLVVSI